MEPDVEAAVTALAEDDTAPAVPAAPAATVPLREEQVQNAVAFLSHPKVRGSSTASKRAFLEGKGLTAAEIDEGLRRVPSTPVAAADTAPAATTPAPRPFAASTTTDALQAATPTTHSALQLRPPQPEPIRWTQVVAGAGAIAAGVWVVHHYFVPPVLRWWRGHSEPSPEDRAAAAVAAAIQAQTSEMRATLESLKGMVAEMKEQRSSNGGAVGLADLRSELRSLALSLEAGDRSSAATNAAQDLRRDLGELKALMTASVAVGANGRVDTSPDPPSFARAGHAANGHAYTNGYAHDTPAGPAPGASSPAPGSTTPSQPSHPASYMEVLEMLERGETPPGIRDDINDSAPDPDKAASEARLKPRSKPWERVQADQSGRPSSASSVDGDARSVRITEIEPAQASSSASDGGGWKPPSVPQRSVFAQQATGPPTDFTNGSSR